MRKRGGEKERKKKRQQKQKRRKRERKKKKKKKKKKREKENNCGSKLRNSFTKGGSTVSSIISRCAFTVFSHFYMGRGRVGIMKGGGGRRGGRGRGKEGERRGKEREPSSFSMHSPRAGPPQSLEQAVIWERI